MSAICAKATLQVETDMPVSIATSSMATLTAADMTSHGVNGVPGVFFKYVIMRHQDPAYASYEISPMKVIHTETRQSFAHFVTS